jgi:hypothetical protein
MATGLSLHIGLNAVDPKHYGGWDGALKACEFDAEDMTALAENRGFKTTTLLTKEATKESVTREIVAAARTLRAGDMFLLTYSGHGGSVPDTNDDEPDDKDETWVLYDQQLVDDELYVLWGRFAPGVRILMLSDSCHSGTMARTRMYAALAESEPFRSTFDDPSEPRIRAMPEDVANKTYKSNEKLYEDIQRDNPSGDRVAVGASVLLISGCQDNQFSMDGPRNGAFTKTLKDVWNDGAFRGNYRRFHREIKRNMPPWQSPNLFQVGLPNPQFLGQAPFTV